MNKLIILAYHGVTDKKEFNGIENYNGLHILKKDFIRQMKFIKDNCNVCSMDEVIKAYKNKAYNKNMVMVTFDDGYKNNYLVAYPILKKLKIPATFYITTGSKFGERKILYSDFIELCVNQLKLDYKHKVSLITYYKRRLKKAHSRIEAKLLLYALAYKKNISVGDVLKIYDKDHRLVSESNIIEMDQNKLFIIGSHSHNHLNLSMLNSYEMRLDIFQSLSKLEKTLNKKIKYFSYPNSKVNQLVINTLKERGVLSSPLAYPGSNTIKTDLFHLKRITVGYNKRPFPYGLFGE